MATRAELSPPCEAPPLLHSHSQTHYYRAAPPRLSLTPTLSRFGLVVVVADGFCGTSPPPLFIAAADQVDADGDRERVGQVDGAHAADPISFPYWKCRGICSSPFRNDLCGAAAAAQLVRPPPCRPVERHAVASLQLAARRSADLLKVTGNKQLKHHMRVFSF